MIMATITVATTTAATAPAIAPTMTSPVLATGEEIVKLVKTQRLVWERESGNKTEKL